MKALKALTGIVAALRRAVPRKVPKTGEALGRTRLCGYPNRMYMVTEVGPGRFLCEVMVQDGHERWHEPTLEMAKRAVIGAAKALNGVDIEANGISVRLRSATA